jgi:carboxyl-terminal processing protease
MRRILKLTAIVAVLFLGMAFTVTTNNGRYFEILKNIEIYTNLYKELNTAYVDDIEPSQMMRTGIDAMVSSLDPYTNYISENEIESYRLNTEGRDNSFGAQLKKIGDYATITEVYKDQPADEAGLKPGDQILQVDGKDAKDKSVEEMAGIMRGSPGSLMTLTIQRPGTADPFRVSVERTRVEVPNVPYHGMLTDDIGYITLTTFTRNAGRNVANALKELRTENPDLKGVVFDLRGNGGGLLSEAVNVSNVFIPRGELVAATKGRVKDWDRTYKTQNNPVDEEIPLVVVINGRSASASEIVCGTMQDYDRGVLIGQRSYGKGLVQNTVQVGYNSRLKLTIAKYYIPSGRCIQSVEYENGEPVDVPEDQRTPFKTRNGRTVLDGGGVKPDIVIPKVTDNKLAKSLIDQDFVFRYATKWVQQHDSIPSVEDFKFEDFEDFLSFVKAENFEYVSETEKAIEKLEATAEKEGFEFEDPLTALRNSLKQTKIDDLRQFKVELTKMIEKEIAGRYYYQEGAIKMGLRNDNEIQEAIVLLNDKVKYNKILSGE